MNSPLMNESSIIESMSRASPYSPEEKKERIERYRSKRNLRNFNKKIKVWFLPYNFICQVRLHICTCNSGCFVISVRVQEDVSRQPAANKGEIREERRNRQGASDSISMGRAQPRRGWWKLDQFHWFVFGQSHALRELISWFLVP